MDRNKKRLPFFIRMLEFEIRMLEFEFESFLPMGKSGTHGRPENQRFHVLEVGQRVANVALSC